MEEQRPDGMKKIDRERESYVQKQLQKKVNEEPAATLPRKKSKRKEMLRSHHNHKSGKSK